MWSDRNLTLALKDRSAESGLYIAPVSITCRTQRGRWQFRSA